jgi:chromosome segregation ATPase
MSESAIPFDFPPPIKAQEIRLVLPDDDYKPDETSSTANGGIVDSSWVPGSVARASTENIDFVSLSTELNEMELDLIEREEVLKQTEARLNERERGLWEFEALILAREKLLRAQQKQMLNHKEASGEVSGEEIQALKQLQAEVARQQKQLEDSTKELKERERFVEASEERLLEKTMLQQEEESRLEQKKEDLDAREERVRLLEGKPPAPKVEKEVL